MNKFSNTRRHALALSTLALAGFAAAPPIHAFGLGDLTGGGKAAAAPVDVGGFLKNVATAEGLMNNSLVTLLKSLGSKQKAAELESSLTAAAKLTDDSEKNAQKLAALQSAAAEANQQATGDKLKDDIKKMSKTQREQLTASAFNFSLAMLQDKALLDQSKSMITSLSSNPTQLAQLGNMRSAASSLGNQLEVGGKIAGLMPSIFSAVGVKAPTSKDDKPKEITAVAGD